MMNTVKASKEISRVFPDTPLFAIYGNHEFYPCDQDDFNFNDKNRVN